MRPFFYITLLLVSITGCKKDTNPNPTVSSGVLIANEGNFNWGNGSVSHYNPISGEIVADVYKQQNNLQLGDVVQSIAQFDSLLFVVVNNSAKVEVLSKNTFARLLTIQIPNSSPRYFLAINDSIGLVSELYANKIWKVNFVRGTATGSIQVVGETGQLMMYGNKILVSERTTFNGNFVAQIRVLDKATFTTVKLITLPTEPSSFAITENGKLIVITKEDANASKVAKLIRFDLTSYAIESELNFQTSQSPSLLRYDAVTKKWKYLLDKKVFSLDASATVLPTIADCSPSVSQPYAFDINPTNGEMYIGDALDYTQPSQVFRYNASGTLLSTFKAGINSTQFFFPK